MDLVVFGDTELKLTGFLAANIEPPVTTRVPRDRPVTFVRVVLTGGRGLNRIVDAPLVTVEAWAASKGEGVALIQRCRALISAAEINVDGFQSDGPPSAPGFDPDPDTDHIRYSFTAALHVYEGAQ